jgi:hypothetical protein
MFCSLCFPPTLTGEHGVRKGEREESREEGKRIKGGKQGCHYKLLSFLTVGERKSPLRGIRVFKDNSSFALVGRLGGNRALLTKF